MEACDFGYVVLVPFPFVDLALSKRRPAVVLSKKRFNAANGQSLMAMITTASGSEWPDDVGIKDLQAAGLPKPSVIRFKVFTLPNTMALKVLGRLGEEDQTELRSRLGAIFGI
jgi:mRNA interferase MazF